MGSSICPLQCAGRAPCCSDDSVLHVRRDEEFTVRAGHDGRLFLRQLWNREFTLLVRWYVLTHR